MAEEVVLLNALGNAARHALLGDEGEQVSGVLGLVLAGGHGRRDLAVPVPDQRAQDVVQPAHREQEVAVRLERQPARRDEAVREEQELAHGARGEELAVGFVERIAPRQALVAAGLPGPGLPAGLHVVQVEPQDGGAHDVEDGLREGPRAVDDARLPVVLLDEVVEVPADIPGLLLEDGLQLPDVLEGEGAAQHLPVGLVLLALHQDDPTAAELLDHAEEARRLREGVAVRLDHLPVGIDAVGDQHLGVSPREVSNEGRVRVFPHPFCVQRRGCLGPEEVQGLTEEEVVVLMHGDELSGTLTISRVLGEEC